MKQATNETQGQLPVANDAATNSTTSIAETLPSEIQTQDLQRIINSEMMPKRFRGKMQLGIELMLMARRHGVDIYRLASGIYEVHGELAIDAKFCISLLRESGLTVGPMRYEFSEAKTLEGLACTAIVRDKQLGEEVIWTYRWVTARDMKLTEKSAHWKGDPRNMLAKRAATQLIRNCYPEVLFGLYTREEAQEIHDLEKPDDNQEEISEWIQNKVTGDAHVE